MPKYPYNCPYRRLKRKKLFGTYHWVYTCELNPYVECVEPRKNCPILLKKEKKEVTIGDVLGI